MGDVIDYSQYKNPTPCKTYGAVSVPGPCRTLSFLRTYPSCAEARYGEPVQGLVTTSQFNCPPAQYSSNPNYWFLTIGGRTDFPLLNLGGAKDMVVGPFPSTYAISPGTVVYFTCPGVYTLQARMQVQPLPTSTCLYLQAYLLQSDGLFTQEGSTFIVQYMASQGTVSECTTSFDVTQTFVFAPLTINGTYYNTGALILEAAAFSPSPFLISFSLIRQGPLTAVPATYLPPAPSCQPPPVESSASISEDLFFRRTKASPDAAYATIDPEDFRRSVEALKRLGGIVDEETS